jgi:hypothetical protein
MPAERSALTPALFGLGVEMLDPIEGEVLDTIVEKQWFVKRFGSVKEVQTEGNRLKYKVEVWDEGRNPFLIRWFNDPVAAADFLENLADPKGR